MGYEFSLVNAVVIVTRLGGMLAVHVLSYMYVVESDNIFT